LLRVRPDVGPEPGRRAQAERLFLRLPGEDPRLVAAELGGGERGDADDLAGADGSARRQADPVVVDVDVVGGGLEVETRKGVGRFDRVLFTAGKP
jgi:hypothetical protein